MRNLHTLTYNETTYIINDGGIKNDIFINGFKSGWYIEYEFKKNDDGIVVPTVIKLKNRHEEIIKNNNESNSYDHYLAMCPTSLQFELQFDNIVEIIQIIKNN